MLRVDGEKTTPRGLFFVNSSFALVNKSDVQASLQMACMTTDSRLEIAESDIDFAPFEVK